MNAAGMMAKYLAMTSLAMLKVVSEAARHQHLLAGLDDLDQLGRVGVEIDHVAGLFGGLRAGVHRHRHVGLAPAPARRWCRRRSWPPGGLPAWYWRISASGFRRRLGEKSSTRPRRRWRRRSGVVAGDHHRRDAHAAQFGEAFLDAALDDVLQLDDAEHLAAVGHHQRRAAARDTLVDGLRATATGRKPP